MRRKKPEHKVEPEKPTKPRYCFTCLKFVLFEFEGSVELTRLVGEMWRCKNCHSLVMDFTPKEKR